MSLGASSTAINVHKAVIEVELCLAPDSISEEVGSGQDSAVDSGLKAGVGSICGLGESCGGRRRKKRKGVRRLMDCILVGDAEMFVFVERFLSRSSLNLESLIVIRVVLDVEIRS